MATPSPALKTKKKRKKKKKKGGKGGSADNNEVQMESFSPKSGAADMTAVRDLLKKFDMEEQDEKAVYNALTNSPYLPTGSMTGPQRMERQFLLELAHDNFTKLSAFVGIDSTSLSIPKPGFVAKAEEDPTVSGVLHNLFHFIKNEDEEPLWTLSLHDATTSPILKAALSSSVDSLKWFEEFASDALEAFAKQVREEDITVLLDSGVHVSCKSVAALFSNLPKGLGHSFNNKVARILCDKSFIVMQKQSDFKLVMDAVADRLGKAGKISVDLALRQASTEMHKSKNKQRSPDKMDFSADSKAKGSSPSKEGLRAKKAQEEAEKKLAALKLKT